MAVRNLLHKTKLEEFKQFCRANNIETRLTSAQYQVLQVKLPTGDWAAIYEKLHSPEHYSIDKRLFNLVLDFIHYKDI